MSLRYVAWAAGIGGLFVASALAVKRVMAPPSDGLAVANVTRYLSEAGTGFSSITGPPGIDLSVDEGAHPDFQTEWWYYTGNLAATGEAGRDEGRRFGYQLTFFRRALAPFGQVRTSEWAADQVYLAHFAVTDVAAERFHSAERLGRGAAGLAGAVANPPRVWLEDWMATGEDSQVAAFGRPEQRLLAADGAVAIDLRVVPQKPVVLHGIKGYSVKGPEAGNASAYYSWTRLHATGTITTADGSFPVDGLSWMDHEWSTSALGSEQVGWDWFSLQLDDGWELMVFQIREEDGGIAKTSSGSLVDPDGEVIALSAEDFEIRVIDGWTSPRTKADYPATWRLLLPTEDMELVVTPLVDDQELSVSFRYWEGAVRVDGTARGNAVSGHGYVELTGYAEAAAARTQR